MCNFSFRLYFTHFTWCVMMLVHQHRLQFHRSFNVFQPEFTVHQKDYVRARERKRFAVQAAILYTNCKGERLLRTDRTDPFDESATSWIILKTQTQSFRWCFGALNRNAFAFILFYYTIYSSHLQLMSRSNLNACSLGQKTPEFRACIHSGFQTQRVLFMMNQSFWICLDPFQKMC